MRHVILFSDENVPARGVVEALRGEGIPSATINVSNGTMGEHSFPATGPQGDGAQAPLAVVFDLATGAEMASLHALALRAAAAWPEAPLVACRREASSEENGDASARLDAPTLRRMGFHAVANEPSQLPAVLREVEALGSNASRTSVETPEAAPASLLLPERLGIERLRAAFEMVASLHFVADRKGAAATALAGLAALVCADRWTIYLVNEAGKAAEALFEPLAVRGLTASERALPEGDWRKALMGDALALAGAQSGAARVAARHAETIRKKEGERRVVAVPLVSGERVVGVLEAVREGSQARQFSIGDASLLSALALPLAAALANSVRVAEAERLSQTDDLTKLHNARHLRQFLTSELKRARRYGSTVTAMFLDLDDFKQVNDLHGHLVGSHVLMEMAGVILGSVRDTDVVARYGGDEFVVILPETPLEQSLYVAERVREHISRHIFTGGRSLRLCLTASFGVASFPQHAQSPQQLIASADAAMYEAKAARKNCVRFAAETSRDF
ncbi:MAG: GGDEF domain-containing protein [Acidobacteria bacterium]|nr:GGDEF domain-containing protein [Acidobacteriota bacterium]